MRRSIAVAGLTVHLALLAQLVAGCQDASEPSRSVTASLGVSRARLRDTLGMSVGLDADITLLANYGFTRLRTDFTWSNIQRDVNAPPSQWNWGPYDSFVNTRANMA